MNSKNEGLNEPKVKKIKQWQGIKKEDRKPEVVVAPIFADICAKKMEELGRYPMEMAREAEKAFDPFRKALKGVTPAGPRYLPAICKILGLDLEEMRKLVEEEKLAMKGYVPDDILRDDILMQMSDMFTQLSEKDKREVYRDVVRRFEKLSEPKS